MQLMLISKGLLALRQTQSILRTCIRLLAPVMLALSMLGFVLETEAKDIAGYVEKARLHPSGLLIRAKHDTGAKTSSLNVSHFVYFMHDGKRWVRFNVTN